MFGLGSFLPSVLDLEVLSGFRDCAFSTDFLHPAWLDIGLCQCACASVALRSHFRRGLCQCIFIFVLVSNCLCAGLMRKIVDMYDNVVAGTLLGLGSFQPSVLDLKARLGFLDASQNMCLHSAWLDIGLCQCARAFCCFALTFPQGSMPVHFYLLCWCPTVRAQD
jgi:hypothetical protein